jgi:hypothetical protein
VIVEGAQFGAGYLLVGGHTAPFFDSPQPAAFQLRANELRFANAAVASPVPGPIVGAGIPGLALALGGLVILSRRCRTQAAA